MSELPRRTVLGYAVGSLGTAAFATVPGLLLLYELTDVLAVPAAAASVVLFAAKAWDVVANPVLGALSDRSAQRTGSRTRFLVAGGCLLPPLFALLFAVPSLSPTGSVLYVGAVFTVATTAYAVFQAPYVGLSAEITESPAERTRITAYRTAMLALGILLTGAGAPALVSAGGHGRGGYALMGVVVAVFLAVTMLVCAASLRGLAAHPATARGLSLAAQLRLARGNQPFLVLFGAFVVQSLGVGVMLAAEPYSATYLLGDPDLATPMIAVTIAPSILVMPLWVRLGRAVRKRTGLIVAASLFGVDALALSFTLHPGTRWIALPQLAVIGIGYAGLQLFALSMLPDTIAADESRSGQRQAGAFSGLWTGGETVAMAAGPALYGAVLAASSFVSSSAGRHVPQPSGALRGMLLGSTLLPGALLLLSVLVLLAMPARFVKAGLSG